MKRNHTSSGFKTKAEIAISISICLFQMNGIAWAQNNTGAAGAGSTSSLQEMYNSKYGSSSQKTNAGTSDGRRYSTYSGAPPVVNQAAPLNFNQRPATFNNRLPGDAIYGAPKTNRIPTFSNPPVQTNGLTQASRPSIGQLGGGDFPLPPAADEAEQFRIPQLDALIMKSAYRPNRIDGSLTPPPGYNTSQNKSRYK